MLSDNNASTAENREESSWRRPITNHPTTAKNKEALAHLENFENAVSMSLQDNRNVWLIRKVQEVDQKVPRRKLANKIVTWESWNCTICGKLGNYFEFCSGCSTRKNTRPPVTANQGLWKDLFGKKSKRWGVIAKPLSCLVNRLHSSAI